MHRQAAGIGWLCAFAELTPELAGVSPLTDPEFDAMDEVFVEGIDVPADSPAAAQSAASQPAPAPAGCCTLQ